MHVLVVGITGSGKSRLIRERIIPYWTARGVASLVLDPVGQSWPGASLVTDDPYRFLKVAQASRRCVLVVDECDETLRASAQQERDLKYLATRSRNDGHLAYFLAQRAMQVPPSYRGQCSRGFIFRQSPADAQVVADLMGDQGIAAAAPQLPPGICLSVRPFAEPVRVRVF